MFFEIFINDKFYLMKKSCLKSSFGFGIASGVITTLGLMVGLFASTNSRGVVLGGILTIAVADSMADAVGMHFSEESEGIHTEKEIWLTTIYTFLSKLVVTASFLPLLFLLSLKLAMILNIIWGFILLSVFSYSMAKQQKNSPFRAISEHVLIMAFVIVATYYLGTLIDKYIIT
ncbi:MAG: hypothetical protein KR126chlam4_01443 [Candidatus Anoxychlamydiales bacterium]|nr:hypothetical protein [Candidatus Anoxychlamydiales bacterium]